MNCFLLVIFRLRDQRDSAHCNITVTRFHQTFFFFIFLASSLIRDNNSVSLLYKCDIMEKLKMTHVHFAASLSRLSLLSN